MGAGLRNKGRCGESKHKRHLGLDVSASVSAWVSGCGTGRGGNGSLNGICFTRGSGEREGSTAVRSLFNPRERRG